MFYTMYVTIIKFNRMKKHSLSTAHHEQKNIHFTFSAGSAELTETDNPQLFVQCSDHALYQARQQGRNCILTAS